MQKTLSRFAWFLISMLPLAKWNQSKLTAFSLFTFRVRKPLQFSCSTYFWNFYHYIGYYSIMVWLLTCICFMAGFIPASRFKSRWRTRFSCCRTWWFYEGMTKLNARISCSYTKIFWVNQIFCRTVSLSCDHLNSMCHVDSLSYLQKELI